MHQAIGEWKLFDPRDSATGSRGDELCDPSVVWRGDRWWMVLAGQVGGRGVTDLYSASLPAGPIAAQGWALTRDADGSLTPLAGRTRSAGWDSNGGRHCPSSVRGWDPAREAWVERIYYAGSAGHLGGPYSIGYLEWDGTAWVDQPEPAFIAQEAWERGSVYEPNLFYHDGKWRLWYVAGSNQENYLVQGYAESADGRTGWSKHEIFAPPEMKMFDFCVRGRIDHFEAVFARVWMAGGPAPPETGLWWCRAEQPSGRLADWGKPVQIMTAEDRGWHSGPWKPSWVCDARGAGNGLVFFNGAYRTDDPGPFPYAFTVGCAEVGRGDGASLDRSDADN